MKDWLEHLSAAWVGVVTHKLRSFLTVLGIVIGVGAVIALMSIGRGAQADVMERIESLGSDLVFVRAGAAFGPGGVRGAGGSAGTLTLEDAEAISQEVAGVSLVAPYQSSSLQLVAGDENMNAQVTGITPTYQEAYNLQPALGSLISDYDALRGVRVVVLGSNVAETLFPGVDPLGQALRMGNSVAHVIGVLESKGEAIGSPDDGVLIPLAALQQMVAQPRSSSGEQVIGGIVLSVPEQDRAGEVVEEMTGLLRLRHGLGADAEDDFSITSMGEIASAVSETSETLTILLGAVAAISLLVGGIGVMNIMLVSVLERTREIGIRKALGARERDIWGQFLVEATVLTFAGGVIGVVLGWVAAAVVDRAGLMSTVVSPDVVVLAISVSAGIGLFFGFYPAWSAARLNPIEALRSE